MTGWSESANFAPPREIAPNIYWIGGCIQIEFLGKLVHNHAAAFLIVGGEHAMLIDTGYPAHWDATKQHIDEILDGRDLTLIAPTHSELAHAGNLSRLLADYPEARIVGDVSDYHLFYPDAVDKLEPWPHDTPLPLGTGYDVRFFRGPVRDLPATQWIYEASQQVMFVGDGFAYSHSPHVGPLDEPGHLEGQCRMFSSELPRQLTPHDAMFVTKSALVWAAYMDASPLREEVDDLFARHPVRLVAPGHGNVIDNREDIESVIFAAYHGVLEAYAADAA
jgi:flavorubredoxin